MSSEWQEAQGPGPTVVILGVILLIIGAVGASAVQSGALDASDDVGSRQMAEGAVLALAGIAAMGLVLIMVGIAGRVRRARLVAHGHRAVGVVTSLQKTMVGGGGKGGGPRIYRYRVRVEEPGGPRDLVARGPLCANEGSEVLVAYDPDHGDKAVLVGVRPLGMRRSSSHAEAAGLAEMQRLAEQIQKAMGQSPGKQD